MQAQAVWWYNMHIDNIKGLKGLCCTDKSPAHGRADIISVRLFFFFFLLFFFPLHFFPSLWKNIRQLWTPHWLIPCLYWTLIDHLHIPIQFRNHPNNRQYVAKAICHLQRCKNSSLLTSQNLAVLVKKRCWRHWRHTWTATSRSLNPAKMQIVLSQSTIKIPLNFKRTKTNANNCDRSTISARTRQKRLSGPLISTL